MKRLSVFSLVFLVGCAHSISAPYRSVCEVRVGGAQGSGTLVAVQGDWALVLTARHVAERVDNSARITWPLATGRNASSTGSVLAIQSGGDFTTDMALIICARPEGVRPVKVSEFNSNNGPWHSYGYRGGKLYESIALTAQHNDTIKLDAPFIQGMSGGCVLDREGNLVGIVVASDLRTSGIASDGEYLQEMIHAFINSGSF